MLQVSSFEPGISLEGYKIVCLRSFSFAKGQQAFESINLYSQYTVKITQKGHLLMWNSKTTQNLSIYPYNYQTETAIFLAAKHEKTIMACSSLNFYKDFLHFELLASNTIKN